ncbi:MAG: aminoacyl-tRNA hydrolase [Candidatus Dasytiphilus stammeri]
MQNLRLIVGIANSGSQYEETRHNAGGWYVKRLAGIHNIVLKQNNKFYGYTNPTQFFLFNQNVRLLIPDSFINLSGKSVAAMAKFYHLAPDDILIAHDELNLAPGIARFKLGGGSGGHNGIKNIISHLGNNIFYRLRIGIGHPLDLNRVTNFVLDQPSVKDKKLINHAIEEAIFCTTIWLKDGIMKAMNRLHTNLK